MAYCTLSVPLFAATVVVFAVLLAYVIVRAAWGRTNQRAHRWRAIGLVAATALLTAVGSVQGIEVSFNRWKQIVSKSACGVEVGMTREQALARLSACGEPLPVDGGYELVPGGAARLAPFQIDPCGVRLEFGPDGRVLRFAGWCE